MGVGTALPRKEKSALVMEFSFSPCPLLIRHWNHLTELGWIFRKKRTNVIKSSSGVECGDLDVEDEEDEGSSPHRMSGEREEEGGVNGDWIGGGPR